LTPPYGSELSGSVNIPSTSHYVTVALIGDQGSTPSADILVEVNIAAGTYPYTAPIPVVPTDFIPPVKRTYETIQDLGDELDRQEFKLETIGNAVDWLATVQTLPPGSVESPVAAPDAVPIDLTGAVGFVVSLAGIPPEASEEFGEPIRLSHVGRIPLGTANGWMPAIDIRQNPQVVAPLPPGVVSCVVKTDPPIAATVMILRPPK
jgi:hypothetical protein